MFKQFFHKSAKSPTQEKSFISSPTGTAGKRAYAIGDVHGRLDLLNDLLAQIEQDNATRSVKETVIVFLGDLIDRGPNSRGVIDRLKNTPPDFAKCIFIMGNHEEALVKGLTGSPHLLQPWLKHGGLACAESYGIDIGSIYSQPDDVVEHVLMSAVPESHIKFMQNFYDCVRFGDYLFVHAGVRPNVPIDEQSSRDLKWIRGEFLESDENFGCVVVHGHSINEEIVEKHNRIGIDTGAYKSGILTAVRIEDTEISFLQARGETTSSSGAIKNGNLDPFTIDSHK